MQKNLNRHFVTKFSEYGEVTTEYVNYTTIYPASKQGKHPVIPAPGADGV